MRYHLQPERQSYFEKRDDRIRELSRRPGRQAKAGQIIGALAAAGLIFGTVGAAVWYRYGRPAPKSPLECELTVPVSLSNGEIPTLWGIASQLDPQADTSQVYKGLKILGPGNVTDTNLQPGQTEIGIPENHCAAAYNLYHDLVKPLPKHQ